MQYSTETTLRIEIHDEGPLWPNQMNKAFALIEKCDVSQIKHLVIHQEGYDRHHNIHHTLVVIIPEIVSRLVALETMEICARIKELPESISQLTSLKLLDLTGSYNLLAIPDSIRKTSDLKIKIGRVVSSASTILFIAVPSTGISPSVFSLISSTTEPNIQQLFIRQILPQPQRHRVTRHPGLERFNVPDGIKKYNMLKSLTLQGNLSSIPAWIGEFDQLVSLDLSGCSYLEVLPESIGNLSQLRSLSLRECFCLEGLPDIFNMNSLSEVVWPIGTKWEGKDIRELTSLNFSGLFRLRKLPESIGNLSELIILDLSGCNHLVSLPESIGNLTKLTSLNLIGCRNLYSLPESIGNLVNITSLNLASCRKLRLLPKSLGNLSKLTLLNLTNCVNAKGLSEIIGNLSNLTSLDLSGYMGESKFEYSWEPQLSEVYGLIKRRKREGEGEGRRRFNVITYFTSVLTNDWMKGRRGYKDVIDKWLKDEKKNEGLRWLKAAFLNVFGRSKHYWLELPGRRMKEVWKDEGKEDSEGRREWGRRWREVGDVMNEEDVMETSIMHLCIPDHKKEKERGRLKLPSECSLDALSVLLNEQLCLYRECAYHFPVFDINDQPSNVVIIRNIPLEYDLYRDSDNLEGLIKSMCQSCSIGYRWKRISRVIVNGAEEARQLANEITGVEFKGRWLIGSVKVNEGDVRERKKKRKYISDVSGKIAFYFSDLGHKKRATTRYQPFHYY